MLTEEGRKHIENLMKGNALTIITQYGKLEQGELKIIQDVISYDVKLSKEQVQKLEAFIDLLTKGEI